MFKNKPYIEILKSLIKPALAIIISGAVALIFAAKISGIADAISRGRTSELFLEKRVETITNIKAQLDKIGEENQAKLEGLLPLIDNLPDVLSDLRSLSVKHKIKPATINLGGIMQGAQLGDFNISTADYNIAIVAPIATAIEYVKSLEALPYFLPISTINVFTQSSTRGWNADSTIQISGKLFVKQTRQ